jgi:hypothetical protein
VFGDPRVTPVTHPLWARMLLRALAMDDAVKVSPTASSAFDTLSGRTSRVYSADSYLRADGVSSSRIGTISATNGVGEAVYPIAIVQGGDYLLRARVSGDPAHAVSAEIKPWSGGPAIHTFSLVPAQGVQWILGGPAHLDPGTYTTSLLLPQGTSLEYVEIAPPCVNPVEPMGGWKPTGITTAEDIAVTALKALDMEDALAPADTPIEREGGDFVRDDGVPPAREGVERTVLKADRKGLGAVLVVELPEAGLYTLEAFVDPGEGQRWRADGCRKAVICPRSSVGWRVVMSQSFSGGRHTFSVTLADQASVERLRLTRRKETPADYVAALRRAGFDPSTGAVSRETALAAMQFVRKLHADRQGQFCGDMTERSEPTREASPATTTVAAAPPPVVGVPQTTPLSDVLLPPQERASPVLPGRT